MTDLREMHNEAIVKGLAVLLAAAGSAIGFALHETSEWKAGPSLYVVAVAIGLWSVSFASGIFRGDAHENTIQANILSLEGERLRPTPAQSKLLTDRFDKHAKAQVRWRAVQLWCLLLGALVYFVGHSLQIREASASSPSVASSPAVAKRVH